MNCSLSELMYGRIEGFYAGNYILTPWGYTSKTPIDLAKLVMLAKKASTGVQVVFTLTLASLNLIPFYCYNFVRKRKWQTSMCFLQTKNGSLFSLVPQLNSTRHLLFQQKCPSMVLTTFQAFRSEISKKKN